MEQHRPLTWYAVKILDYPSSTPRMRYRVDDIQSCPIDAAEQRTQAPLPSDQGPEPLVIKPEWFVKIPGAGRWGCNSCHRFPFRPPSFLVIL